jgi:RNA recognition motif-containing protein
MKEEIRMNIYVGNLSYQLHEDELKQAFESFGEVASATIITDKMSGRSKGFGFVEMPSDEDAKSAIEEASWTGFSRGPLTVNEARPRQPRERNSRRY